MAVGAFVILSSLSAGFRIGQLLLPFHSPCSCIAAGLVLEGGQRLTGCIPLVGGHSWLIWRWLSEATAGGTHRRCLLAMVRRVLAREHGRCDAAPQEHPIARGGVHSCKDRCSRGLRTPGKRPCGHTNKVHRLLIEMVVWGMHPGLGVCDACRMLRVLYSWELFIVRA